jgi:hypothetical protein
VFANVARDAWRQYVRRPLAVPLVLAGPAATALVGSVPGLATAVSVLSLVAGFLLELFLVAYLASALDSAGEPATGGGGQRPFADAWAATTRSILPGVRAELLELGYVFVAILIGLLFFGKEFDGSQGDWTRLLTGSAPLIGFMLAFLTLLRQPIVLDGQRRVLLAAALSHRVAARWFPICLVVGVVEAVQVAATSRNLGMTAVLLAALAIAVVQPLLVGVANALYLRTRAEVAEPKATRR